MGSAARVDHNGAMLVLPRDARRGAAVLAPALLAALAAAAPSGGSDPAAARAAAAIDAADLERHVAVLADPGLEGRDSPSAGLARAAAHVADAFAAAGIGPAPDVEEGAADPYLRPFTVRLPRPAHEGCELTVLGDAEVGPFDLGRDYVPVSVCTGSAEGEVVFAGYGIDAPRRRYADWRGRSLKRRVALILDGEPRHPKLLDGPEVTEEASLWRKVANLRKAGATGVLVVRRAPEGAAAEPDFGFRYTWARWNGYSTLPPPGRTLPVLEVTPACASALLGRDVEELAREIDAEGDPVGVLETGVRVALASDVEGDRVRVDNVVAWLPGTDPALRDQVVVVGAHYDHVGVDPRGRVGAGADDNASGTAALLEIAQALAADPPRRSVLLCAFASEEDGLLGSRALLREPPVDRERIVAMLNLDMVGRGPVEEVAVIGVRQNPHLGDVLDRALALSDTGVEELTTRGGEELFKRSDHYAFHEVGIPALFFFEGLPISRNRDYHTWRDTADLVDPEKVRRTAHLVFNTAWILANDDEPPPGPR